MKVYSKQQATLNAHHLPPESRHMPDTLERWVPYSVYISPNIRQQSFAQAWAHAQRNNIPIMDIYHEYHEYLDIPWIQTKPMEFSCYHRNFLFGKNLYKEQNLLELYIKHTRDRDHKKVITKKISKHYVTGFEQLSYNHTPVTESLVKHRCALSV